MGQRKLVLAEIKDEVDLEFWPFFCVIILINIWFGLGCNNLVLVWPNLGKSVKAFAIWYSLKMYHGCIFILWFNVTSYILNFQSLLNLLYNIYVL